MYQPKKNEELFDIKPIGVRYKCPYCNEGEMLPEINGSILLSDPPMFKHICPKCTGELILPKRYPYIEWMQSYI